MGILLGKTNYDNLASAYLFFVILMISFSKGDFPNKS
jgi:hypothetical protein